MAATGFTPISLYYSSTASATPTAGNLVAGELAINTADGKLFYKDSAGVVQVIGTKGGVGSSTTTQVLYNSSGLVVGSANMTFDGTKLTLANDASISGLTVGKGGGANANNTVVGYQAANSNSASSIEAFGYQALYANTSGANNSAFGFYALQQNTTGSSNNAFGRGALAANTTGSSNTAFGYPALNANTTGGSNTAVGTSALASNTTASNNTAVGYQAGYSNTTGGTNTFIGRNSGYSQTIATDNTFIGTNSGYYVTTGSKNTILGGFSGNQVNLDIRTLSNWIVLSDGDGNPRQFMTNDSATYMRNCSNAGDGIVVIGQPSGGSVYGYLSLGASYSVASSKDVALGLSTTAGARIYVQNRSAGVYLADGGTSWTSNSDERLKTELMPFENAAKKVASIRTGTGRYLTDDEAISRSFLIAQDVQAVLPEAVDVAKDELGTLGVAYTDLIPLLVASIKELKEEVDSLKAQLGK